MYRVVADENELRDMMARPLALWRIFLHHSQAGIAYRPTFNGPARVTGGPGTGKTVVAMHRANHLASQLGDRTGKPILFTTYTANLAEAIERDLRELGGAEVLDVVEVTNIDKVANRIVRETEGNQPGVIFGSGLDELWASVADEFGTDLSPEFLASEWEQVILAQECRSRDEYFKVSRTGRGVALDRRGRANVWAVVEAMSQRLIDMKKRTFFQLADDAAGHVARRTVRPYQHVIIDEAQDLHETQWRLVRSLVEETQNDLFIVGDSHQRIYDRRASLSKVGINIAGRSHKLRINYRTTHEILLWALAILGEATYDDLDEGTESHDFSSYHSFLHGPQPRMSGHDTRRAEFDQLVTQLDEWIKAGVREDDIVVTARTANSFEAIDAHLNQAGIPSTRMGPGGPSGQGVRIGTMHRLKGTEFRCVAVLDVDDETVPLIAELTDANADKVQHSIDLIREQCLLYVACTRAREDLWVGWSGAPSRFLGSVVADT
jgi:superfamily I DNA/RNA helicase